jgi:hypothetical protein
MNISSLFLFLKGEEKNAPPTNLNTYTIYTKVCGHPFKLVDLAISATPLLTGV